MKGKDGDSMQIGDTQEYLLNLLKVRWAGQGRASAGLGMGPGGGKGGRCEALSVLL